MLLNTGFQRLDQDCLLRFFNKKKLFGEEAGF